MAEKRPKTASPGIFEPALRLGDQIARRLQAIGETAGHEIIVIVDGGIIWAEHAMPRDDRSDEITAVTTTRFRDSNVFVLRDHHH